MIPEEDWDRLNTFAKSVGWHMLFDFNVLLRRGPNWNSHNAEEILQYTVQQGYQNNLSFELGNGNFSIWLLVCVVYESKRTVLWYEMSSLL